jgi:hypothetical protein
MKLPAYGRDLIAYQRQGKNVPWLIIALDFSLGKSLPRVVVTDDTNIADLDLNLVAGLDCTVAHKGNTIRALDVAELALKSGANLCGVFDRDASEMITTDEVRMIRGMDKCL